MLAICAFAATDGRAAGLGSSKATAIEVCGPSGANAYFDRLACSELSLVKYERIGLEGRRNDPSSKGDQIASRNQMMTSAPIRKGERDFHMIDRYGVDCPEGRTFLFVDRYHCPDPKNQGPPQGFSFIKSPARETPTTASGERGPGLTKDAAIPVCGPTGERNYLDRLRCPDGTVARVQRSGSMGTRTDPASNADDEVARRQFSSTEPLASGQKDFHMVDGYDAECGARHTFLYLDPYHCPDPKYQLSPPGLSFAAGATAR
jgi:hypothetical protein